MTNTQQLAVITIKHSDSLKSFAAPNLRIALGDLLTRYPATRANQELTVYTLNVVNGELGDPIFEAETTLRDMLKGVN